MIPSPRSLGMLRRRAGPNERRNRIAETIRGVQAEPLRYIPMYAMCTSHLEQWLPNISKADAVDNDRPISLKIFADVWLVDGLREDIAPHKCD